MGGTQSQVSWKPSFLVVEGSEELSTEGGPVTSESESEEPEEDDEPVPVKGEQEAVVVSYTNHDINRQKQAGKIVEKTCDGTPSCEGCLELFILLAVLILIILGPGNSRNCAD